MFRKVAKLVSALKTLAIIRASILNIANATDWTDTSILSLANLLSFYFI
jgi:hypothetical protein